jgi:DNA-directed RNA polymerase specialized sigma subunit
MRNDIVNKYLPLVVTEAERIRARLSFKIELNDLVSTGIFAMIDYVNSDENSQEIDRNYIRIIRKAIIYDLRNMAKWVKLERWYSLSREEQLIFVLYSFERVDFPEIAELMDISEDQVEQSYSATVKYLNR